MNKLKVAICSSPACYPRSARLFKELGSALYTPLFRDVELSGASCGSFCTAPDCPLAPCVRIDGELLTGATAGDVLASIRARRQTGRLVA